MTDNNNKSLFSRGTYEVVVGDSAAIEGRKCYHVINTTTGVIEFEEFMLPSAISWCKRLADYDPYMEDVKSGRSPLAVVDSIGIPKR